ncbi:Chitinase 1 [Datura stramonium]|uniref:chitinase n=1 Tax=Datura stramonium TaxID=4076 RepID=A0ABS8SZF5_DATST|nr:Chitinase 1 [Datura stramonium]
MEMRSSYSVVATFSVVTMLLIIPTAFSYTLLETMAIVAAGDITEIINSKIFDELLPNRNDKSCSARGFYTYDAFVEAARFFDGFGTTGSINDRKREVAAFLAQTSHVTTGGSPAEPDDPYEWGYCNKTEAGDPKILPTYCVDSTEWPCASGKKYYGRGPFQIKYNYNYGPCGVAIDEKLLSDPDLVASDKVISFKSAIWFWMTPQSPKPSSHDAILADEDIEGRPPGFGLTTNIINGAVECGHGFDPNAENRVGFYLRYCSILGVDAGDHIECIDQTPFI